MSAAASAAPPSGPEAIFSSALELAGNNNQVGWRQLEIRLRRDLVEQLPLWRTEREPLWRSDGDKAVAFATTDTLVDLAMSRLTLVLAGVYSTNPSFADQRRALEDLLSIPNWRLGGTTAIAEAPRALVFVLHYLHGAVCMELGKFDTALAFARTSIPGRQSGEAVLLCNESDLIGGPMLLGGQWEWAWEYLTKLQRQRPVLEQMFALAADFNLALTSYSMLLSLNELALEAAKPTPSDLTDARTVRLDVAPLFLCMPRDLIATASRRIFGNREIVAHVAADADTTSESMRELWPSWTKVLTSYRRELLRDHSYFEGAPFGSLA